MVTQCLNRCLMIEIKFDKNVELEVILHSLDDSDIDFFVGNDINILMEENIQQKTFHFVL